MTFSRALCATDGGPDLADLRGQPHLHRALEVAAAGGHSLLMVGPPGSGKSMAAVRLPSILPPMSEEEALGVARIASACGRPRGESGGRPFRAPHHTISTAGLLGTGNPPRFGEATLAHRGVLFLDQLSEFRRDAREALTAALRRGSVSIRRGASTQRFPCRCLLVAAADPCPCGRGGPDCHCAPAAARRYQARLNAAITQLVDIAVSIDLPSREEVAGQPAEASEAVRERVIAARERQAHRLGAGRCNADADADIAELAQARISDGAQRLLDRRLAPNRPEGPRHTRVLQVARTLADLAGTNAVSEEQMLEALLLAR